MQSDEQIQSKIANLRLEVEDYAKQFPTIGFEKETMKYGKWRWHGTSSGVLFRINNAELDVSLHGLTGSIRWKWELYYQWFIMKGKKEKFLFSLRKYITDFMMKIYFDLQCTTDIEKGGRAPMDFFISWICTSIWNKLPQNPLYLQIPSSLPSIAEGQILAQ